MASAKFVIRPAGALQFSATSKIRIEIECDRRRIGARFVADQSQAAMSGRALFRDQIAHQTFSAAVTIVRVQVHNRERRRAIV